MAITVKTGRYWIAIYNTERYPTARNSFKTYLQSVSTNVTVVKTETNKIDSQNRYFDWYLFDIVGLVNWPTDKGYGTPTIARSEITSADDIVAKPPDVQNWQNVKTIGTAIGVIWLASKLLKRRRRRRR